jgi:hypothetical protein
MLHAMSFEEIMANDMVMVGRPESGESHFLPCEPARPDGPALLGTMPYDMADCSMTASGAEVVPKIRQVLARYAAAHRVTTGSIWLQPCGGGFCLVSIGSASRTDETALSLTSSNFGIDHFGAVSLHRKPTQMVQTHGNRTPEIEFTYAYSLWANRSLRRTAPVGLIPVPRDYLP